MVLTEEINQMSHFCVFRYRLDMINWSTKIRLEDYTYFCRAAEEKYNATKYRFYKGNLDFKFCTL